MAVGDPIGNDLCSKSFNASTLPSQPNILDPAIYTQIVFDTSTVLKSGVKYAIIIETSGVLSTDRHSVVWEQVTSDQYAGGLRLHTVDDGSTWVQASNRDCMFYTQATGVDKDSFAAGRDAYMDAYDTLEPGQSFTASSDYTITSVRLPIYKERDLTTGTVKVSIRNTVQVFDPPVPTGKNNMLTVRRLIAAANNKIWYESI